MLQDRRVLFEYDRLFSIPPPLVQSKAMRHPDSQPSSRGHVFLLYPVRGSSRYRILKYIPQSLSFWKRRAVDAGKTMDEAWTKARSIVDERRAHGDRRDCIVDNLLDQYEKKGEWPMSQHGFNNLLGELVEGAADTTAAQLLTLILALAKNPAIQEKARVQIDQVCRTERSPLWTDFGKLPYINQIVKEGMRWKPV